MSCPRPGAPGGNDAVPPSPIRNARSTDQRLLQQLDPACMRRPRRMKAIKHGTIGLGLLCSAIVVTSAAMAQAPDQAAMMLNSARKAFNEKSYPFAVTRYKEFLAKFGGHKEAPGARYGLALALLANPPVNYQEARDLLQGLAGQKNLPEYPQVVYHLGLALRGQGVQELAIADAKPQEANQRRDAARQRFDEARQQFTLAT